jgi:hypothetical protein
MASPHSTEASGFFWSKQKYVVDNVLRLLVQVLSGAGLTPMCRQISEHREIAWQVIAITNSPAHIHAGRGLFLRRLKIPTIAIDLR